MMKSTLLTLALLALGGSPARADHGRGLRPANLAGLWTGVVTGTIQGTPYIASSVLTVARDGQTATESEIGVFGASTSDCQLTSFNPTGIAVSHCIQSEGFAPGLEVDVNLVLTDDEQKLLVWISMPGVFLSGQLTRP